MDESQPEEQMPQEAKDATNDAQPVRQELGDVVKSWLTLQKIIKEEITLRDIITKQQEDYQKELQKNYFIYYEAKLKIREKLENVISIDNNNFQLQYFKLVDKPDKVLRDAIEPIRNLFILLRGNFDYILKTISIIDEEERKNDLSLNTLIELFCHQFYDHLLIPDPEQEDLLRLCYLLIEKEIAYMNSASVYAFIDENSTFVGKFLKSYTKKQELKTYLSMTLGSLILSIENTSDNCLDLNPSRIQMHLQRQGIKDKKSDTKLNEEYLTKDIPSTIITIKNLEDEENDEAEKPSSHAKKSSKMFHVLSEIKASLKYNNDYPVDITQEELSRRLEIETDPNLKDFYMRQLERINKDPEIFTNKRFFLSLDEIGDIKSAVLVKYKENFIQIKDFIDNIIQSLLDKLTTIPYTLRCICKVIDRLIAAKFPKISNYERNAFIGEFIFGKCILPILINSDINAVITSSILSLNTRQCLKTIAKVLTKINRGLFFEASLDTDFTIFNHYIIEVIPLINKFYLKLIDVQLPNVIEEMLERQIRKGFEEMSIFKKLNKKYKQQEELMKKQPEEISTSVKQEPGDSKTGIRHVHCCICYSIEDILLLLKIIRPRVAEYSSFANGSFFEKTIEKIYDKEYDLIEIQKKSSQRLFFLFFREPLKQEFKASSISSMSTTLLNDNEDSNLVLQRIKYCIRKVLTGLNLINSKDYSYFLSSNTNEAFLKALKNTLQELEEFGENELISTIPLKWYSGYIYNNRKLLPDNFKDNDYKEVYEELLKEEKDSLEFLKQNSSVVIAKNGMNVRFTEKLIEKAKRDEKRIGRIEQFMKIEKFITNTKIEVCFARESDKEQANANDVDDDKPKISITPADRCMHKRLSFVKNEGKNPKGINDRHATDIKEFITKLSQYKEICEDIERGLPNNKIYQTLETYLELIKAKVKQDIIFKLDKEAEYKVILERIGDHIMKNMYNEVFPKKPLQTDLNFQKKTEELISITPAHLEIKPIYVNELKYATECVRKINEGKSAYEKLQYIEMAHNTINNTIKFSSGKNEEAGADELSPLFHYIIIKARPSRFYSNINYINTVLPPNLLNGRYGFLLAQMESSAEFIMHIDIETLNKTKEEFEKKMKSTRVTAYN